MRHRHHRSHHWPNQLESNVDFWSIHSSRVSKIWTCATKYNILIGQDSRTREMRDNTCRTPRRKASDLRKFGRGNWEVDRGELITSNLFFTWGYRWLVRARPRGQINVNVSRLHKGRALVKGATLAHLHPLVHVVNMCRALHPDVARLGATP
jgi:hypothetical protein